MRAAAAGVAVVPAAPRNSRHIFQQTHSSRMPPASSRPTIASSSTAISANTMRSTVAATMPTRIARARCSGGKPAAASPMTTALSPASTRSIMMTWSKAAIALCEQNRYRPFMR